MQFFYFLSVFKSLFPELNLSENESSSKEEIYWKYLIAIGFLCKSIPLTVLVCAFLCNDILPPSTLPTCLLQVVTLAEKGKYLHFKNPMPSKDFPVLEVFSVICCRQLLAGKHLKSCRLHDITKLLGQMTDRVLLLQGRNKFPYT